MPEQQVKDVKELVTVSQPSRSLVCLSLARMDGWMCCVCDVMCVVCVLQECANTLRSEESINLSIALILRHPLLVDVSELTLACTDVHTHTQDNMTPRMAYLSTYLLRLRVS